MEIISRQEAIKRGLRHYFTGRPCKRGHIEPRFVSIRTCMGCERESSAKYKHENAERLRQARLEDYSQNPEKYKAPSRRWKKKNKKKVKQSQQHANS